MLVDGLIKITSVVLLLIHANRLIGQIFRLRDFRLFRVFRVSSRRLHCQSQRRHFMAAVHTLGEVGHPGDGRKVNLAAELLFRQNLPITLF